jgi:hypothetical protein
VQHVLGPTRLIGKAYDEAPLTYGGQHIVYHQIPEKRFDSDSNLYQGGGSNSGQTGMSKSTFTIPTVQLPVHKIMTPQIQVRVVTLHEFGACQPGINFPTTFCSVSNVNPTLRLRLSELARRFGAKAALKTCI